ncbi:MAG: NAD(P)-dependent oxidoreductase [Sulfurospirillaceae bacterium]|nr:NAD(P)-dependent oxidoreductase [Sulfurospirillaceae bacterium]
MKVVLVFGATGFLGSNLIRYLLSKNLKVVVYKHINLDNILNLGSDDLIIIDSFDENLSQVYQIDTIYHLASKVFSEFPEYKDFYETNVELTRKIINYAKFLKINQFVYISTGSIFSRKDPASVFDETTCPNPKNYYGLTKYIAEKLVEIEFEKTDIKTCIVRFPSIFGVNSRGGIVETFYTLAKENKPIEVYSNGQKLRNLIYVESAAEMLYLLYKNQENLSKNEIFMAGSEDSLKLIDVARLVVSLTNSGSVVVPVDKFPPSDFDVMIDTTKAQKILGFQPLKIQFGLKRYIKDMENENI